jgi:putative ABC transport system permease protein
MGQTIVFLWPAAFCVKFLESHKDMRFFPALRQAIRSLRSRPAFTAMAVVTLPIGLTAVCTIFCVVNTVILERLPYRNSSRIVTVTSQIPGYFGSRPSVCTLGEYLRWKKTKLFQYTAAIVRVSLTLTGKGRPEQLHGASVTPDFFHVFGVRPQLGRIFRKQDATLGHNRVVILSHQLWTQRFGSDPGIIGKTIELNQIPFTVIGVMPARFDFPRRSDVASITDWSKESQFWAPYTITPTLAQRNFSYYGYFIYTLGRLRPGVSYSSAEAQLRTIAVQLFHEAAGKMPKLAASFEKDARAVQINVTPLRETMSWGVGDSLWMLLGAIGLLLVLVLFNVGGLLVTRNAARLHEFAMRRVLGASRWQIFRQSLIEQGILVAIAAGLSILLSEASLQLLRTEAANRLPRFYALHFDFHTWLVLIGISLVTALLFGATPLLLTGNSRLGTLLKSEGRSATGDRSASRLRAGLMVGEVAISIVLLVGAGLLVESFIRVMNVSPGFDPQHLLTFTLSFNRRKHRNPKELLAFKRNLLNDIRAIPGVQGATEVNALPLTSGRSNTSIKAFHQPQSLFEETEYGVIGSDFFRTLRIPLIRGRFLRPSDSANSVVINQAVAKRLWPNEDPIGRQLVKVTGPRVPLTVIGVAGSIHNGPLDRKVGMQFYQSMKFSPYWGANRFIVRTRVDPMAVLPEVETVVWRANPDLPISEVQTMEDILGASTLSRRFQTSLLTGFAAASLLLASLGLFGITALSVLRRTREFGIRMALGATSANVVWLELSRGLQLLFAGIAVGVAASAFATRALQPFLFGVSSFSLAIYGAAVLVLFAVTLLAIWLPARRAARIDPTVALRYE